MPILLALLLIALATPLDADPCEDRFRAGLAANAGFESGVHRVETALFAGLGWVTAPELLARLERQSALTTACDELAGHRRALDTAGALRQDATRNFDLAAVLCHGLNRERAQQNVDSLGARGVDLHDLTDFLDRVARTCRE